MEDNVIEVCIGVGMDQIFPETIKVIIDGENTLKPIVEKGQDRDYDKYYYFEL
jgi:hypothetical protein